MKKIFFKLKEDGEKLKTGISVLSLKSNKKRPGVFTLYLALENFGFIGSYFIKAINPFFVLRVVFWKRKIELSFKQSKCFLPTAFKWGRSF